MRDAMKRLAGFLGRRRRWVVGFWIVVVLCALPFAAKQTENLTGGGFDVPGSQSQKVSEALQEEFGGETNGLSIALDAAPGASAAQREAEIGRVARAIAPIEDVTLPRPAVLEARRRLAHGNLAILPLRSELSADELIDTAGTLREELAPGTAVGGVTPYLVGQPGVWAGFQEISKKDLSEAEVTGFPIVLLILLVVFGSLAAALLPLALGFASVLITGAVIYFISLHMTMSVFVTNMASMIGIGVAIDYSLFILARYREEREAGADPAEARSRALATSGLAVTFSGLAVVISLAGLWMVDNQALRSMGLGAMIVVAVSILTATTLLPALIAMLGDRVLPGGVVGSVAGWVRRRVPRHRPAAAPASADPSAPPGASPFWSAWTARVMARPWLAVIGVAVVLLTLAIPVLSLQTGTQALQEFPKDSDVRIGNELVAKAVGGGTDPIYVVAAPPHGSAVPPGADAAFAATLRATPGVHAVAPPVRRGGDTLFAVTPVAPSESDAAVSLVERLRDQVVPATALGRLDTVDVGGETARGRDARELVMGSLWKIVVFVLALSFLVLMVMLRSLILPLKAVAMNLLSISAAFGVLVAIFQWGRLDGFLGFESQGAIETINVPLIFAVVFGLSMDYEVFLMSRIRERWLLHGDNERAVAEGLSSSARTISSAALIMVCVFSVFVLTGVPSIKEIGLGCAIAIALDATLVRLVLVPAAMKLMGGWNWWLPAWLDRSLPNLSFEGDPDPQPGPPPVGSPVGAGGG
jgi:RND superfamily putative drug exporter